MRCEVCAQEIPPEPVRAVPRHWYALAAYWPRHYPPMTPEAVIGEPVAAAVLLCEGCHQRVEEVLCDPATGKLWVRIERPRS